MSGSKAILNELFDAVVAGNVQKARKIAEKIVDEGMSASTALDKMMDAMRAVDKKYTMKEYFTVDVAAASTAMREAVKVIEPYLKVRPANVGGRIVIGSLKGNIQGLGKDIVAAALRSAGFLVTDLGVNVSPEVFVNSAVREKAQIIAISVSVNETVPFLKQVAEILHERKFSGQIRIVIGGRAVSEEIRREYGIDAYAKDAWEAVEKIRRLLNSQT